MDTLSRLIGVEHELEEVGVALCRFAERVGAVEFGALHVTCSDESEREASAAFDRSFVRRVLPELKPGQRVAFRSINLGARYEWGAIRVAEEHYATPAAHEGPKLVVAKINSHVAARATPEGVEYGWLDRYGDEHSACCGALRGMLEGSTLPAIFELRDAMAYDGLDRRAVLADPNRVPTQVQALYAAIVNAQLQSARAVKDIGEYRPATPTIFLVLPCVTINRPARDTELVVGQWGIDRTTGRARAKYAGLGDDPREYAVDYPGNRLTISDPNWPPGE